MELYERILSEAVLRDILAGIPIDGGALVEKKCYQAICRIYAILSDASLDDPECFERIKKIVCVLDDLGIGGGGRHDF